MVPSEISDLAPCAHAQRNILHFKYAEKTDDYCLGFGVYVSVSDWITERKIIEF